MYVLGHVGISLLLFAPFAARLLSTSQPLLAALIGGTMLAVGVLPDIDTHTDRLAHRGRTHTIWFALAVGLAAAVFATTGISVVDGSPINSHSLPASRMAMWFGGVSTLAVFGHLAGDIVTPMGLWPFRPLSERHYVLEVTPSKSPRANWFCFAVGSLGLLTATGFVII